MKNDLQTFTDAGSCAFQPYLLVALVTISALLIMIITQSVRRLRCAEVQKQAPKSVWKSLLKQRMPPYPLPGGSVEFTQAALKSRGINICQTAGEWGRRQGNLKGKARRMTICPWEGREDRCDQHSWAPTSPTGCFAAFKLLKTAKSKRTSEPASQEKQ